MRGGRDAPKRLQYAGTRLLQYSALSLRAAKSQERRRDPFPYLSPCTRLYPVESVESVAADLFDEWQMELEQYTNPELRRASTAQLTRTKTKYEQMIDAMHRAERTMTPVLNAFRDQVLFLKHNLNARAIASIQDEADTLKADIARLVTDMEKSIAEAEAFVREMGV